MDRNTWIGLGLTLLGGTLWGLSGTCAQFLQQQRGIDAEWLVTVRMLVASLISVTYCFARLRLTMFKIFTVKRDLFDLVTFGLLGMALCQYSYFRSIYYAGAGIATVLQYVAPTIIILFMAIKYRHVPKIRELISVFLALIGTALIALKGSLDINLLNTQVLFWGLLSAVAVAIYSTQPVSILRNYGSGVVVGLGMLLGGITCVLLWRPLYVPGIWDMWTYLSLFTLIILGTVVAFTSYLEGVRRIGAVKGSILSSVEPISASLFGWAILNMSFSTSDIIGFILILSTIFILAKSK